MIGILQLLLATILGGAIGFQREVAHKAAGVRTHAFVAVGSCLFTILSRTAFTSGYDPSRVAAQVVVGIGFLGAGLIFHHGTHTEGLTTAAGLWVVAAIGMAAGTAQYALAIATTVVALLLLAGWKMFHVDEWMGHRGQRTVRGEPEQGPERL